MALKRKSVPTAAVGAMLLLVTSIASAAGELIFTAPPRESREAAEPVYGPLVDYLSRATGERVVYLHPDSWVSYFDLVTQNKAHIYFSEAPSVGYHVRQHGHRILARGPDEQWLLVARHDAGSKLAGRPACLLPPPDTGFLLFMSQHVFDKPTHAAHVVPVEHYEDAITGLINQDCQFSAVASGFYELFPAPYRQELAATPLAIVPGQAFTASRKVDSATVDAIQRALLSEQGQKAITSLRDRFLYGAYLVTVNEPSAYTSQADLLLEEYLQPINRGN